MNEKYFLLLYFLSKKLSTKYQRVNANIIIEQGTLVDKVNIYFTKCAGMKISK